MDRIQRNWIPFQQEMAHRRSFELTEDQAGLMIYQVSHQANEACGQGILQSFLRGIQTENLVEFGE